MLGRPATGDPSSKLVVKFDPSLSRQHARLEVVGERVAVTRSESKHPLLFRGRSQDSFNLLPGDSFQTGATTFQLVDDREIVITEAFSFTKERLNQAKETQAKTVLRALLDVQPILSEWKDPPALFSALLPVLGRIVPQGTALMAIGILPDGSQRVLASSGGRGRKWQPSQTLVRNCLNEKSPLCHVWEEMQSQSSLSLEPTAVAGASWAVASPILAFPDNFVIYALGTETREPGKPSVGDTDRAALALVCHYVGKHFESRRAVELAVQVEAERGQRLLSDNLFQLNRALTSTLDARSVVDRLLCYLEPVVPFEAGYAFLREHNSYPLYVRRGGDASPVRPVSMPPTGPLLQALSSNEFVRSVGSDPLLGSLPVQAFPHVLAIHLTYNKESRGILVLARGKPFSDTDVKMSCGFASQVGAALENARLYHRMRVQAMTDELTGLFNRRHVLAVGRERWAAAAAERQPFSAVTFDVDHFKKFNDNYGHDVGDMALRAVAHTCRCQLRNEELVGRVGGEEFVILVQADLAETAALAERFRQALAAVEIPSPKGSLKISASLGVAQNQASCTTLEDLLKLSDMALYQAKASGRNRVCCYRAPA